MNKKIARVFTVAAMAVMALALCLGMTACGNSKSADEKLIKDAIDSELAGIKNMDADALSTLASSAANGGDLSTLGVTSEQFIKAWFDGFDYKVNSVTVNDKTATASVSLTIKDFAATMKDFSDSLDALLEDSSFVDSIKNLSESKMMDALSKKSGEILMSSFAKAPMKTVSVELPYTLKGKTWEPNEELQDIVAKAILGDLSSL